MYSSEIIDKCIYHLEIRLLATPISLGLSWPLIKPPFGVAIAIYFLYGVYVYIYIYIPGASNVP